MEMNFIIQSITKKSEIQNVLHRFINYKFKLDSNNYLKQLNQLNDWIINDYEIAHNSGNYFKIIANKIELVRGSNFLGSTNGSASKSWRLYSIY